VAILRQNFLWDLSMTSTSNQALPATSWYRGANVPMRVIRRFARQVAEQFQPDKIILFGSHAYGQPHADSDVDILVVMPARNQLDQAAKIHLATLPPFPVHLLVRTPDPSGDVSSTA
jgi:predicted nucleotidyltransferase